MVRFFFYVLLAIVMWKIVQTTMRILGSGRQSRDSHAFRRRDTGTPPDFRNIKDADFEDITPKEPKGGPGSTKPQ